MNHHEGKMLTLAEHCHDLYDHHCHHHYNTNYHHDQHDHHDHHDHFHHHPQKHDDEDDEDEQPAKQCPYASHFLHPTGRSASQCSSEIGIKIITTNIMQSEIVIFITTAIVIINRHHLHCYCHQHHV